MVSRNISPKPRLEDNEKDVVMVGSKRVSCNGGGGALGHPLVYMDMGDEDYVICKYCDKVFKLDPKAVAVGHH